MKNRAKLDRVWQQIPEDTDVIVVHGPPKGVLDFSHKRDGSIEMCGCSALKKRIDKIKPKLVLFGHIHNNRGIINSGVMSPGESNIVYSNGSVVTDGEFGWLTSNGNIIEI
jgi:Icc-related predicted phosphoesterase